VVQAPLCVRSTPNMSKDATDGAKVGTAFGNLVNVLGATAAVAALLVSCGSDDSTHQPGSPGDYCEPTAQGAQTCQSRVCATVTCSDTLTNVSYDVSACTGSKCTTASACPSGSKCIAFPSSSSWCVPTSACDSSNQTPVTGTGGSSSLGGSSSAPGSSNQGGSSGTPGT